MKLTLERKTKRSPWLEVVAEAIAVVRALRALDERASVKLSAGAFIRDALTYANTTREKTTTLRQTLEGDPTRFPRTWAFMRQAQIFIAGPNCHNPPRDVGRLRFLGAEAATPELATVGSHPMEAFALAVVIATDRHPEAFGSNEDWQGTERKRADLREKRTVLLQRIEQEATPADLQIIEGTACSLCARRHDIGYTVSGGAVVPGPGSGERLIEYLITQGVEV